MNRRDFIGRSAKAGAGTIAGGLVVLSQAACGENAITWAGIAIQAFADAQPIIADILPSAAGIVAKALSVARQLQKALKDKSADALTFLRDLIKPDGLFNQLLDELQLIKDANQRKIISGILALARIALTLIANKMEAEAKANPALASKVRIDNAQSVDVIESVAASPVLAQILPSLRF